MQFGSSTRTIKLRWAPTSLADGFPRCFDEPSASEHLTVEVRRIKVAAPYRFVDSAKFNDGEGVTT